MTKEKIRDNLKMLEENLPNFHEYTLQFINKKELRKMISAWRWFVSHDSFAEKQRKPVFPASAPPITWLHSQLQGRSTPLSRDIGICIQPVVRSSIEIKHAAKRIKNHLNMLYHYVSKEDTKTDQAAQHKINVLDPIARKKHTEYERERRKAIEAKKNEKTPEQEKKITDAYNKKKEQQRKEEAQTRELAKKEAQKKGKAVRKRMEREMRQRRRDEFGIQA